MQNFIQKFRQNSIVFEKRKIENFGKVQLPLSLIIFVEILHTFSTYQSLQKSVWDFFYFI